MGIRADRRKRIKASLQKKQEAIFEISHIYNFCNKCEHHNQVRLGNPRLMTSCSIRARPAVYGYERGDVVVWTDKNGTFVNEDCPSLAMMLLRADVDGQYNK